MKYFAIYSRLDLIKKPGWLDAFSLKYAYSNDYHVTLKQTCRLAEADIPAVQDRLDRLFEAGQVTSHAITLSFTDLVIDEGTGTTTLMINAEENESMRALQKGILEVLSPYRDFVIPEAQAWEENFHPHITIASDLPPEQYKAALTELGSEHACEGIIRDVALIIVDKMVPEEADKAENQTIYRL